VELVLNDAATKRVVVRRPRGGSPEETLRIVTSEHRLLTHCAALGLPVPRPCFLDLSAGAVVLEYVAGAPRLSAFDSGTMLKRMADQLAAIHRVPLTSELSFLKARQDSAADMVLRLPKQLDESLQEGRLRSLLSQLWPWPQHNSDVLLHGDYWPGNLLWRGEELAAVLDWEEAEVGDPLADVAVSRLDILWAFGEAAMHCFTNHYREQTRLDWRHLPHWDLCIALRPMSNLARWAPSYTAAPLCRPDITESSLRAGHGRFVELATQGLGIPGGPADAV
jgi:aminoglycoside phosphotransferase (APT) family kinase protein